jgi:hypothetical protein
MNQSSYGETSGFTTVSCEDLQTVNGGEVRFDPLIKVVESILRRYK